MKKIVPLVLMSLLLAGCFQVEQVVTVNPDGSGTLEESFLISRMITESMAGFGEAMAEPAAEGKQPAPVPKAKPFFSDEDIRKRAAELGEGVTFVSMQRIGDEEFEGYRAVFAFRDISRLRLDKKSDTKAPAPAPAEGTVEDKGVRFQFKPGKPAILTMKQIKQAPHEEKRESPAGTTIDAAKVNPEQLDMLRRMFAGLRFRSVLVIKGNIVDTNATYRNGSRITLMDIDFDRLLDKPEQLAIMAKVPQGDMEAALEAMRKLPGMEVDLNEVVRVTFQ
ncbi:MAG TPA: hypothetical protein VF795_11990 [Desulfuromonadaceae bacterium]